jgi:hypothetical protein
MLSQVFRYLVDFEPYNLICCLNLSQTPDALKQLGSLVEGVQPCRFCYLRVTISNSAAYAEQTSVTMNGT